MLCFGIIRELKEKSLEEKFVKIWSQLPKNKNGMIYFNYLKYYRNFLFVEIHEINMLGYVKCLCLGDSSYLKCDESGICIERKILSPVGKRVLGRLLNVLGCELDECK